MANGPFIARQKHVVEPDALDKAIASFEAAAARFSVDAISDANVRAQYAKNIKRISDEVKKLVDAREITVKEGTLFCHQMRNKILVETREVLSPQTRAYSVKKKPVGLPLENLLDKYAGKEFKGKLFSQLSEVEKNKVYYKIIESSGRNDVSVTSEARKLRVLGKVFALITGVLAAHAVLEAEDKAKEALRQGVEIGGGMLGGYLASLGIGSLCGPAAPVCAVAVRLIGAAAGGIAASYAADELNEEIEEFARWQIN